MKIMKRFRTRKSDKKKLAKRRIKEHYYPPYGKALFETLQDVKAELDLFQSETPSDVVKAERALGAIATKLWDTKKKKYSPTDEDYDWLRGIVR